jgi:uncharacterized protein (TIGR03067 family)
MAFTCGKGWFPHLEPQMNDQRNRCNKKPLGGKYPTRCESGRIGLAIETPVGPDAVEQFITREIAMKHLCLGTFVIFAILSAISHAAVPKDEAIKKDRQQIEGTWQVVALEINGGKAKDEDARKLTVVNGADGTWSVLVEGKESGKGNSTFDPTQKPKTIDFTPTEGDDKDKVFLGIYEIGEKTRKLCFAPVGKDRPTEFSSALGSEHILVKFERVSSDYDRP